MTLVKWAPKPVSLFNEMDSMVNSLFGNDWNLPVDHEDWSPAVDVKETHDNFLINADIPGFNKKDIKVNIIDQKLMITGESKNESNDENSRYHYRERRHGSFNRTFNLPESVNEDKISASFKNGILEIKLPKHEHVLPKEKEITIS